MIKLLLMEGDANVCYIIQSGFRGFFVNSKGYDL